MTQIDKVKAHLEAGKTITNLQAIGVYGIFRLSSVIEDLRARGMEIDCVLKRDEAGKQYGEYRIRKPLSLGARVQVKPGHGIGLPFWVRKLREATVVGSLPGDSHMVRFVRGRNVQTVGLLGKELVRVD